MTYDEFRDKLRDIKEEFKSVKGADLTTVEQLERYIAERKNRRLSRGLKSLRGLNV